MKPVDFSGSNVVFAKDQPEYLPLPARREPDGRVTTCWALSWRERLSVILKGRVYLDVLTFNQPLQPLRPYVEDTMGTGAGGLLAWSRDIIGGFRRGSIGWMRGLVVVLALTASCAPAYADAPATPRPRSSPSPRVELPEPPDLPPLPAEDAPTDPPAAPVLVPFAPVLVPFAPAPSPTPTHAPSLLTNANAAPLRIATQLGMMATMTGEAGTAVSPTMWVDIDGPIAYGERRSLGRIGARLGLSSAPGETINASDLRTYRSVTAALRLGRVVGRLRDVSTTVVAEASFATLLPGAADPAPLERLVRAGGIGLRFDASRSNTNLTTLLGFDEASASCGPSINCTGFGAGPSLMFSGQVSIAGGVLFGGDVTLSLGSRVSWIERRDVFRLRVCVDPVAAVKAIAGK